MHDHRLIQPFQRIQYTHHLFNIMPVNRSDILNTEILKKTALHKKLSDGIFGFLHTSGNRITHMRDLFQFLLHIHLEVHIRFSCPEGCQMLRQSADIL